MKIQFLTSYASRKKVLLIITINIESRGKVAHLS